MSLSLLHIQDQKASGTDSGGSGAGVFDPRTLNTVLTNEITGASVASNQITLPAGTYRIDAHALTFNSLSFFKFALYDTTAAAYLLFGSTGKCKNSFDANMHLRGQFVLTIESVLEVRHYTSLDATVFLYGTSTDDGELEVYLDVRIWQQIV